MGQNTNTTVLIMRALLVLSTTICGVIFAHPSIITDKASANQLLKRTSRGIKRPCWVGCGLDKKCFTPGKVCFSSDETVHFDDNYEEFAEIAENDYGEDVVRKGEAMENSQRIFKQYISCHVQDKSCREEGKDCSCNKNLKNYFENKNHENFGKCINQIKGMNEEEKKEIGYKFYMDIVGLGWNTMGDKVVKNGHLSSPSSKSQVGENKAPQMKNGISLPKDTVEMPKACMDYIQNLPSSNHGDFPKATRSWFSKDDEDDDENDDDYDEDDENDDYDEDENDDVSGFVGKIFQYLFEFVKEEVEDFDDEGSHDGNIVELFCLVFEIFDDVIPVDTAECSAKQGQKGSRFLDYGTAEDDCKDGECEKNY